MFHRGNSWYSDFWHDGKRYAKSWGAITKTVAKEKDRKFRTEVLEGKHASKSKRVTFETFAKKYLEYAGLNKKPKSAKRNEVSINMLMSHFKGKMLGSIHSFMLEKYKKDRKEEGRAPATINRDVVTLKNMMRKAVEWNFLSQNLLRDVKQLKEDNERMWVLTPEEEKRLLEVCQKSPQRKKAKYLKDIVLFALHSGMREAEIFNLRKDDVNLGHRFVVVTDTKNNEGRNVPINDTLKEILERRMRDQSSEYIFYNSKGEKLTVLTNAFYNVVKRTGLVRIESRKGETKEIHFRFHDCRHTFGSRLGMIGTDLKTIMEIMGHKTTKMAMRYQHPMPSHKLEAVKMLDQVPSKSTTEDEQETKVVSFYK
jgi:integrase